MQRWQDDALNNVVIKFKKTGLEIQSAINDKTVRMLTDIETRKAAMLAICKDRDVPLQEILDAGDDEEAVMAYSSKATSNVGASHTRTVLDALQRDLQTLRRGASWVASTSAARDGLIRVSRNVAPGAVYELTYRELECFGF